MKYSTMLLLVTPALLGAGIAAPARAQAPAQTDHTSRPGATATRTRAAIHIDGKIDEAAWAAAVPVTTFTQIDPAEGKPVSQPTEARVLYDDDAIYVAFTLTDAGAVRGRLGRRDMPTGDSDWVGVIIDSYHDHRTGFSFNLNPAGVRRDGIVVEGEDPSWDPVWEGASNVTASGWSAEYRIPFSQLRFSPANEQQWGIQLERIIGRNGEYAVFAFTPKGERSGPPSFGHLGGLANIPTGKRLEVLPYAVAKSEHIDRGQNPFREDAQAGASVGVDLTLRATSNLTLNATINPDFGQVEVDPAVVNLSAFETFYAEKRPFFVEGADNFNFGSAAVGPGSSYASLFYSRRIGRSPQLGAPTQLADLPSVSTILGAAKLSGRTQSGWTIGALDAVTQRENARYQSSSGETLHAIVEPLANYFVGRVNRQMNDGQRNFGATLTAVNRSNDDRTALLLRSSAYAGGIDFSQEWSRRTWRVSGFLTGSRVSGSTNAIALAQRSPARYYQRPDATHLELDPNATSLAGYAAQLQIFKQAGRHVIGDFGMYAASPGYEINDLGFQSRADDIGLNTRWIYNERNPGKVFRSWQVFAVGGIDANYNGDVFGNVLQYGTYGQFLNFSALQLQGTKTWESDDDRLTRGGPMSRSPGSWNASASYNSDRRRQITLAASTNYGEDDAGGWSGSASASISAKPADSWNFSIGPRLDRGFNTAQFVTSVGDTAARTTFGRRYVFADLHQTTLSVVTRLNVTFSPVTSLELFAQPFISSAAFGDLTQLRAPGQFAFDPYSGSAPIGDRDFNVRSLRGNAVFRWEYRPGSTLYVAWQQSREGIAETGDFKFSRDTDELFRARPDNVLLLKVSYWLNP